VGGNHLQTGLIPNDDIYTIHFMIFPLCYFVTEGYLQLNIDFEPGKCACEQVEWIISKQHLKVPVVLTVYLPLPSETG
jgi:hypothetical protein